MKKNIKLPTILGLVVLTVGLVAGIFLINKSQVFRIGADISAAPQNVRVTNITDASLTVTWTTDIPTEGFVKWETTDSSFSNVSLEDGSGGSQKTVVHSVNLTGITSNTNVFIKINSEGTDFDNSGIPWQAKTQEFGVLSQGANLTSGIVLEPDGVTPAKALVYLTVNGKLLSTLTSNEGSFIIPLSSYLESINDSMVIEISVTDAINGSSQAVIYPGAARSVPTMVIGKTYDFRTINPADNDMQPVSSLTIPESVEVSSRFEVIRTGPVESDEVTLDSVNNGEIINTTNPEFFGTAPGNVEIEILVESDPQADTVIANTNGEWNWSPPNDLVPGEHKVTIKWKDASGIFRTLTRTFIVNAADGPAFESSSSGNLATPSPVPTVVATQLPTTPTATPVATLSPTSTSFATQMPTPETGSLTPTLGLFIMGIGVLISSIFVYKKSNA